MADAALRLTTPVPTGRPLADRYRLQGWWRDESLRHGLEAVAQRDPGRLAVVDNASSLTYEELRDRVERSIVALRQAGVSPGDAVVLIAPNRAASVVAFAAVLRAEAAVVALDRRCGALDVANAVDTTAPRAIVVPQALRSGLAVDGHGISVLSLETLHLAAGAADDWAEPDRRRPALVLFTSGTTSRPKGVVHHLHSFTAGVDNLAQAFGWTPDDAPFLCSPLASITGLSQVQLALRGGHIVLDDQFDPPASLDLLERHGATLLGGAPVILELLFAECRRRQLTSTSLRTVALGGSMIPAEVVSTAIEQFDIRAVRVYGSSEAPTHTASGAGDHRAGTIPEDEGRCLGGGAVRVGSSAAAEEVLVQGPNLFQGYLAPEDNRDAFVEGWFRTGDLGEMNGPQGRLTIRGRLKEVVARKGLKISLAETDDVLRRYPGLVEGAAFGVPDPQTGERLAVALHMAPGAPASYEDLSDFLRRFGVAKTKLPEQVDLWPEPLPRTPSGKVQRRALASPPPAVRSELAPRLRPPAG